MIRLLRLVIGVPLMALGLILLFGGLLMALVGPDTRAGGIIMGLIGLTLVWVGRKFTGTTPRTNPDDEHWRSGPATNKQKTFARELGIEFPANISKGDLSDLISEETGR